MNKGGKEDSAIAHLTKKISRRMSVFPGAPQMASFQNNNQKFKRRKSVFRLISDVDLSLKAMLSNLAQKIDTGSTVDPSITNKITTLSKKKDRRLSTVFNQNDIQFGGGAAGGGVSLKGKPGMSSMIPFHPSMGALQAGQTQISKGKPRFKKSSFAKRTSSTISQPSLSTVSNHNSTINLQQAIQNTSINHPGIRVLPPEEERKKEKSSSLVFRRKSAVYQPIGMTSNSGSFIKVGKEPYKDNISNLTRSCTQIGRLNYNGLGEGGNLKNLLSADPVKMDQFNEYCSNIKRRMTATYIPDKPDEEEDETNENNVDEYIEAGLTQKEILKRRSTIFMGRKSLIPGLNRTQTTISGTEEEDNESQMSFESFYERHFRKLMIPNFKVYDSMSEDEEDININDRLYYEPDSKVKKCIDFLLLCYTFIYLFISPIEVAYSNFQSGGSISYTTFNVLGEAIFIFDFVLSFFTAFFDNDDNLVITYSDIAKHYLKSWFALDFINAIPVTSILNIRTLLLSKKEESLQGKRGLIELLKLIKLLKIFKIISTNYYVTEISGILNSSRMGSYILIFATITFYFIGMHILACIYIFIGDEFYPNWIILNKIDEKSYIDIYIAGSYFINVTIFGIGYGDMITANIYEREFTVILLMIGIFIYSWLVSMLSKFGNRSYFMFVDKNIADEFNEKLSTLEDIKHSNSKFINICNKIERYLQYKYLKRTLNINEIFDSLPVSMKNDLIIAMYKPIIDNFVFFKYYKNKDFIIQVLLDLEPVLALKNDVVFSEDEFVEEMVFVKRGRIAIELPLPEDIQAQIDHAREMRQKLYYKSTFLNKLVARKIQKKIVQREYVKLIEIRDNEHFGDIVMFLNQKSPLRARASSKKAELFLLKRVNAVKISMSFPIIWKKIIQTSVYNMNQINNLITKTLDLFYQNNEDLLRKLYEETEEKEKREREIEREKRKSEKEGEKDSQDLSLSGIFENTRSSFFSVDSSGALLTKEPPKNLIKKVVKKHSDNLLREHKKSILVHNKNLTGSIIKKTKTVKFLPELVRNSNSSKSLISLNSSDTMKYHDSLTNIKESFLNLESINEELSQDEELFFTKMPTRKLGTEYEIDNVHSSTKSSREEEEEIQKKKRKYRHNFLDLSSENPIRMNIITSEREREREKEKEKHDDKHLSIRKKRTEETRSVRSFNSQFSSKTKSRNGCSDGSSLTPQFKSRFLQDYNKYRTLGGGVNLMSQIESNIENHSLNLQNPQLFYKNQFGAFVKANKKEKKHEQKLDELLNMVEDLK